mmetsp:Transcript_10952/g.31415  ORF Transcript_10952/g.31415 Transcript_10952/m.31415 type:complete len:200 (-) Transcript_10952:156-755(-)
MVLLLLLRLLLLMLLLLMLERHPPLHHQCTSLSLRASASDPCSLRASEPPRRTGLAMIRRRRFRDCDPSPSGRFSEPPRRTGDVELPSRDREVATPSRLLRLIEYDDDDELVLGPRLSSLRTASPPPSSPATPSSSSSSLSASTMADRLFRDWRRPRGRLTPLWVGARSTEAIRLRALPGKGPSLSWSGSGRTDMSWEE